MFSSQLIAKSSSSSMPMTSIVVYWKWMYCIWYNTIFLRLRQRGRMVSVSRVHKCHSFGLQLFISFVSFNVISVEAVRQNSNWVYLSKLPIFQSIVVHRMSYLKSKTVDIPRALFLYCSKLQHDVLVLRYNNWCLTQEVESQQWPQRSHDMQKNSVLMHHAW